jgi:hypothetical protein
MYKLYEMLERHGLGVNDDFPKIAIMSARQVRQMHEELFELVFEAQNERVWGESSPAHDAFSFLTSASLRGTSGCSSWECLATKLHFLGRYAALYANELTFPLRINPPRPNQELAEIREWLVRDLFALLMYRPLVTGGVIVPVVMRTQHCVHEMKFVEETRGIVLDFSNHMAKGVLPDFELLYQNPENAPNGKPAFYLNGPEEYIKHGGLVRVLEKEPDWLPKKRRYNKDGMIVVRNPLKEQMVQEIFADIADNITFFLAYGLKRNARFLSDMPGETDFLELINHDEELDAKSSVLRQLEHSVPVLMNLPFATILRVRNEEKEAFDSYRDAVTKMSAEILETKISRRHAREMMHDAIEPELKRMKKELKAYRKIQTRRLLTAGAGIAAAVLLGAYAGMPTVTAAALGGAAAWVGAETLANAADAACTHGPEFKQKNDLYFLLRLQEEG